MNGSGANNQFLASGSTLTYSPVADWRQYIRATCTVGSVVSSYSNYSTVQTGPEVTPLSDIISPATPIYITASDCPVGTTYLWETGETTPTITKSPNIYTTYQVKCTGNLCQSSYGIAYIYVGDILANNDSYTTNIYTPISGNFCTNDGVLSPKTVYVDFPPTHGNVVWDNSGAFTYTPTEGYTGIDSFKYFFKNEMGSYSNYATVNINVVCPNTLLLSSSNNPTDDFNSGIINRSVSPINEGSITATNKITGTANVSYQAKSIQLNAGFKADNGTVFTAEVGGCASTGSTPTMQVNGRFLYDADNQKTILVGANLPLLDDWDFPASDKLTELEKTGANAVRIEWYMNYGQPTRPAYSLTDLDNFLTKCKTNKMIPIVDIHDFTCGSDISVLNSQIIPWWTSAPVLAVINKHKKYLIINLANELGVYRWAGTPATALTTFKNAYKTAITSIRNAGIDVPIMIDAPDCGSTIGAFNTIGAELITHDPNHNLLLSAHAYWAGYDGTSEIATSITNNLPIVFGELANKQDELISNVTQYCYYDIDGTTVNHPAPTGFRSRFEPYDYI